MATPGDVGRQGGGGIDGGDRERAESRDRRQAWQARPTASTCEMGREATVDLLVPPAREKVAPVLGDEPDPETDTHEQGLALERRHAESGEEGRDRQDGDAERDLVHALAEHVHPRPERVLLDSDQGRARRTRAGSDPPPTGPVGQA